jgi:hypothetical protein
LGGSLSGPLFFHRCKTTDPTHGLASGVDQRTREPSIRNLGEGRWLGLLRELDESGILLHDELQGKAREVLMAVRKKGQAASTWAECYQSKSNVILDSGKRYTLKRKITHAIHKCGQVGSQPTCEGLGSKTPA